MTDGRRVKCISPFKMKERSGKWQEHLCAPFTGVSESCHGSKANSHPSSLTKEHKVSESPDMCQGGGRTGDKGPWPKPTPGIYQRPLCQEYSVKLDLTAFKYQMAISQVWNLGGRWSKLPLFLFSLYPFVSSAHLPLPSPPSVCLVSPSVRLVSLHAGRQPVSLSSF